MKKTLRVSVFIFLIFRLSASAQCTPDSLNFPKDSLISPSSLSATAGLNYDQVVVFRFPSDTSVALAPNSSPTKVHINTVSLDSVGRMPKSFAFQCGHSNCTYRGGQFGCVTLTGSPVASQIGNDSLEIYFTGNITIKSGPLSGITTNVVDSGAVLLTIDAGSGFFSQQLNTKFVLNQNYPNPFDQTTEINFNAPSISPASFVVRNELGQVIYNKQYMGVQGLNTLQFDRKGIPEGMYFYSIQSGDQIITRRMVIHD